MVLIKFKSVIYGIMIVFLFHSLHQTAATSIIYCKNCKSTLGVTTAQTVAASNIISAPTICKKGYKVDQTNKCRKMVFQ